MGDKKRKRKEEAEAAAALIDPHFATLWVVAVFCVIIGSILLSVGNDLAHKFSTQLFESSHDTGLGQIVWGSSLLGLAVITLLITIGAGVARWRP
jgi:ABC-type phosphate transport system permease subunit